MSRLLSPTAAPEAKDLEPDDCAEDDEFDEDEDDDIDAEAQEIARRLGEELWADISKVQAAQASQAAAAAALAPSAEVAPSVPLLIHNHVPQAIAGAHPAPSREMAAAISTMKTIMLLLERDPSARSALVSSMIPGTSETIYAVLQRCIATNRIEKDFARPLCNVLVIIARSEPLFGSLRHTNASTTQLDKGKRKREGADDAHSTHDIRVVKRPYVPDDDLHSQISDAVRVISQSLSIPPTQQLSPAFVSSIRLQLHQVFLFAMTSSGDGGHQSHVLQEIGGLIQVIGVLSGIQIGQITDSNSQPLARNPSSPWDHIPPGTDIGTAVYPCHNAGCRKTFSRLYNLRAHQRSHAMHRPFKCNECPASFTRNHDLKRHVKLHGRKAWKCGGCHKVFSRRDAIKRHKNGTRTRGPRTDVCLHAAIEEVELGENDDDVLREERRAKIWNGISIHHALSANCHDLAASEMEAGEIQPAVIASMRAAVMSIHGLLQAHVGSALGMPATHVPPPVDPTSGQATLASVIARAQLQNRPNIVTQSQDNVADLQTTTVTGGTSLSNSVPESQAESAPLPSLSMYGLSDEQAKMLELAIANAAAAAQAQAEAEAALEEENDGDDEEEDDEDEDEEVDDRDMRLPEAGQSVGATA